MGSFTSVRLLPTFLEVRSGGLALAGLRGSRFLEGEEGDPTLVEPGVPGPLPCPLSSHLAWENACSPPPAQL